MTNILDQEAAAYGRIRQALQDLVETARGSDTEDTIGSILHLVKEGEDALEVLTILEGPEDQLSAEELAELDEEAELNDTPEPCELCDGQGFGADSEGAVACPQCNGTAVQPENVRRIDDELGLDD
jgi:hypothetical protein